MQIFGDEQLVREVMAFLREWDNAIARLEIQDIIELCRPEIRLVDVSMEVKGVGLSGPLATISAFYARRNTCRAAEYEYSCHA